MRLCEAYIENFGTLHQQRICFDTPITVLLRPNGTGKTTLAAFLQAMLYGLSATARRDLDSNDRRKYDPWQGGAFGGWLEIETAAGRIRISRSFGLKPRSDTVRVTDCATGRPVPELEDMLGMRLFGVDAEVFQRSVYFPQRTLPEEIPDSLNDRLRALLNGSSSPEAFQTAMQRLEAQRKQLQPLRGSGGQLGELRARQEQLRVQEFDCLAAEERAAQLQHESEQLHAQQQELQLLESQLEAAVEAAQKTEGGNQVLEKQRAQARSLFRAKLPSETEVADALRRLHQLEAVPLSGTDAPGQPRVQIPAEAELNQAAELLRQLDECRHQLDETRVPEEWKQAGQRLEAFFHCGLPKEEQTAQWAAFGKELVLLERPRSAWASIGGWVLLGCGILSGGYGAWRAFGKPLCTGLVQDGGLTSAGLLCAAGGIALAAGAVLLLLLRIHKRKRKARAQKLRQTLEPICMQYAPEMPLAEAATQIAASRTKWSHIRQQLIPLRDRRAQLLQSQTQLRQQLDDFFSRFGHPGADDRDALAVLRVRQQQNGRYGTASESAAALDAFFQQYGFAPAPGEAEDLLNRMQDALRILRSPSVPDAEKEKAAGCCSGSEKNVPDLTQLLAQRTRLRAEMKNVQSAFAQLQLKVAQAAEEADALDDIRVQQQACAEALREAEHKRDLLDRTSALLLRAQDQLSAQYLEPLKSRFLYYFRLCVRQEEEAPVLDPELHVRLSRMGGERELGFFSSGTRTSVDFCMRLALMDLLFTKERPFLILDDPFVHLDDAHLSQMLELVRKLSENAQILYLTCHSSRAQGLTEAARI